MHAGFYKPWRYTNLLLTYLLSLKCGQTLCFVVGIGYAAVNCVLSKRCNSFVVSDTTNYGHVISGTRKRK